MVAVPPVTPCTYMGIKMAKVINAAPYSKPSTVLAANSFSRNMSKEIMGSAAFVST
ncbi:hypothetical protein D3C81_1698380 [compost metagenome]